MGYKVFVNSESNKNIKEVKEELEKIRKNIEYVLFLLGDDASYNTDIGYDVNNILAEKTQMNSFLLGLCNTFNNQNMGDARDSATYMDNIVDKLLEAYHKYLLTN